jgi:hypothetical protein
VGIKLLHRAEKLFLSFFCLSNSLFAGSSHLRGKYIGGGIENIQSDYEYFSDFSQFQGDLDQLVKNCDYAAYVTFQDLKHQKSPQTLLKVEQVLMGNLKKNVLRESSNSKGHVDDRNEKDTFLIFLNQSSKEGQDFVTECDYLQIAVPAMLTWDDLKARFELKAESVNRGIKFSILSKDKFSLPQRMLKTAILKVFDIYSKCNATAGLTLTVDNGKVKSKHYCCYLGNEFEKQKCLEKVSTVFFPTINAEQYKIEISKS